MRGVTENGMMRAVMRQALFGAVLLVGSGAVAGEPLAERLVTLRSEVEQLNHQLELLREEQRSTLAGLAAQRAELSAAAERQQLAAREAERKLEEVQARVGDVGADGDGLKTRIYAGLDALAAYIAAGLPFKREERIGELEAFRQQVASGALPPARAINRLWAFFEDELRLTRDISLHPQTIALGQERVLGDVIKLGTMALYLRTSDGRFGLAEKAGGEWRFVVVEQADANRRIRALFDALGKQIRQGYFELPLVVQGADR